MSLKSTLKSVSPWFVRLRRQQAYPQAAEFLFLSQFQEEGILHFSISYVPCEVPRAPNYHYSSAEVCYAIPEYQEGLSDLTLCDEPDCFKHGILSQPDYFFLVVFFVHTISWLMIIINNRII